MSVTVQSIVSQVADELLEPNPPGFLTGTVTQAQVLSILGVVLMDFLRKSGLIWSLFTQQIVSQNYQYGVPDSQMEVFHCFIDGKIVQETDLFCGLLRGNWTRQYEYPRFWHQDGIPNKTVELIKPPNFNGIPLPPPLTASPPFGVYGSLFAGYRGLTFVASTMASKEVWGIGDTLDTIPDTFTPYLVFGILEHFFGEEGELRDEQRALYCRARFTEGVMIARTLLRSFMEATTNA